MTATVDHRPTTGAVAGSALATSLLVLALLATEPQAAIPAAVAIPFVIAAGVIGSRRALRFAAIALVLALLLAGIAGTPPAAVLAAGVLSLTAIDLLEHGFSLGDQVGREATARRSELLHGGATLLVGTVLAAVLIGVFSVLPTGWPVAAIVFAVLAGLFALIALEMRS